MGRPTAYVGLKGEPFAKCDSFTYNWFQALIPLYYDFQTIVSHLTIVLFQFKCLMHRPRRRRVGFFLLKSQAGPPLGPGTRQEFCT